MWNEWPTWSEMALTLVWKSIESIANFFIYNSVKKCQLNFHFADFLCKYLEFFYVRPSRNLDLNCFCKCRCSLQHQNALVFHKMWLLSLFSLSYIQYETNLLQLISMRREAAGYHHKKGQLYRFSLPDSS